MTVVDVVVPIYNAESTVGVAIESLLRQSFSDANFILVDDGSTDMTAAILSSYASRDARIRIVRQTNCGIVAALNAGLAIGTAPYIARLDADDIADHDRLERQVEYLEAHPDCVAVSSYARHIDVRGNRTGTLATFPDPEHADPMATPAREPYLLHPFLVVRRAAIARCGVYRAVLNAEDSDLYWRLQEVGSLHVMPEVLGSYRLSPLGISSGSTEAGRTLAAFSQLSALSALRRRGGRTDLKFDVSGDDVFACANASHRLVNFLIRRLNLDSSESKHFAIAYCGKLLELTSYRPYELEASDCKYIAEVLGRAVRVTSRDRLVIRRARAIAIARLARKRLIKRAWTLLTLDSAPEALVRLVTRH